MKKTFFDKIFLGFFLVIVSVFILLVAYTTYSTKSTLIKEKQSNLLNEAELVAQQSIINYISGTNSADYLTSRFNEFEEYLNVSVWYANADGKMIAVSNKDSYAYLPDNLFDLDSENILGNSFTITGTFYDIFTSDMISIGVPIYSDDELQGYILLHTSLTELDTIQSDIFTITYFPFLAIILVSFILLAFLSSRVLLPLAKINATAKEYSKGNFDAKINISRNDEIGELANSLECMASDLSKLDEYRKNFIANISHDFRSPLTSIKGYIEAIIDGTIPPEMYDKYLNIVLSESNRLTKLTSGLLELNNFDTYGPILKRTSFNIVDIIKDTTNTFEGRVEKKSIQFKLKVKAEITLVYADKTKIQQVIYNLIDNAIKFSPKNSAITIEVTEKNEKLFIAVIDQGTGIEKDKQKNVWERFYKTDSSRGRDKQGTGLGLSITKEIIKAHGENINLISTEGVGSEFIFSLTRPKEGNRN